MAPERDIEIHGLVDRRFSRVRDAFAANFAEFGEVGAACCVYVRGHAVVDVRAGVADATTGAPWCDDTIAMVFSSTKGVTAACMSLLAERGAIDPDAPVARYWPEFAQGGKESIPVRWALSHRAGVPAVDARSPSTSVSHGTRSSGRSRRSARVGAGNPSRLSRAELRLDGR
jgi:CubicO group peptidase (beta-lactamase class C family)